MTMCWCAGGPAHEHRPHGGGSRILACPWEPVSLAQHEGERPAVTRLEKAVDFELQHGPHPEATMKERLTEALNRFPEVEWDRWVVSNGYGFVYGWIDNPEMEDTLAILPEILEEAQEIVSDPACDEDLAKAMQSVVSLARTAQALPMRKDFVVLHIFEGHVHDVVTSSEKRSVEFGTRLGFDADNHIPCRRVEDDLSGVDRSSRRRRSRTVEAS